MGVQFQLPAQASIVEAISPAADAGGRSGAWISLKNAIKAYVLVNITQGNAATVALTFQQATAIAGTGAKALASGNMRIWANQDVSVNDTLTEVTAAQSFTTSAAVKNKLVLFEINPAEVMDINNGFDCIQVITGASNAANITQAVYILTPLGFSQATPPSAVLD